ncbi:hypothetical protein F5984_13755 [Rudanella paleaurantiibacter]|uniref:Uncharacterized protein n=1 Tax=Rudanella paleaurantiibacter TaxID=2614655 RepID=A0A7J5TYN3_9BACT|nr:hypothetical protein [Rudanella paleaurantiibacter]KAB7730233.1 hypothetical protein F5984_13755 [Rudanella paleaurantiibacter]
MPFITQSNFSRIVGEMPTSEEIQGELYKTPIYFFNKTERYRLLRIKQFLQLGEDKLVKVFIKVEREDTQSWIFEGGKPAYHKSTDCSTLNGEYVNFPIPEEIKEKNQVKEFREWFKENSYLLEDSLKRNEEAFALKIKSRFGVNIEGRITRPNSGKMLFIDLDLEELEKAIDNLLEKSRRFYGSSSQSQQAAIKKYSQRAFLYLRKYEISDNDTGLSEEQLRQFLQEYDQKFKQPVKDLLTKYYMVKYNPKLEFKGSLLEQLGFKECQKCYGN